MKLAFLFCIFTFLAVSSNAQRAWQSNLDSDIQFYQTTDLGILLVGTDTSLNGIDGSTGQRLWRKKHRGTTETSITPVPGTDLILFTLDEGSKSRLQAIDLLTGKALWRTEKVRGDVLQLAVDPERDLIAVVIVKDANGVLGEKVRRKPIMHIFELSSGKQLWKRGFVKNIEMMPTRFDRQGDIPFALDNYRAPILLGGRLFVFYEGVTSYDARTGKNKQHEKFGVNEGGLALTDADPIFDGTNLYVSGRGKIRAVNRRTGKVRWRAKDLGVTPEMALLDNILYVRTGGQFTRIKDGEIKKKGPFGVSAIDTRTGKRLWRYKGADTGMTNFVFPSRNIIIVGDRDELIALDAKDGKRLRKTKHKIKEAQFVLVNEQGLVVVGGRDELAAFGVISAKSDSRSEKSPAIEIVPMWRVKHKAPKRGVFRVAAGIALRATAIYFRYGGLANSALNAYRGAGLAKSALSFRWSGLQNRFSSLDLTTLAGNSGQTYFGNRIRVFGIASRTAGLGDRVQGLEIVPSRGKIIGGIARRATPASGDVQASLLERLDPVRRLEQLSSYFLRRKRLSALRGKYMYFYTDLPKPFNKKGLIGVNLHTGQDVRSLPISNPDPRFITDEINGLLYSADGKRLLALELVDR